MSSTIVETTADAPVAPDPDLRGHDRPRICSVPTFETSAGTEALELAAHAGLILDPWESWVLDQFLGERDDGTWAAFEAGILVSRQNGKGSIFEARVLAGLFLFHERLILYSAHEFKTAREMFLRIKELIEGNSDLSSRVRKVTTAHGEEGIELKSGQRLRFIARSRGSGRGFTGETNIWDEAQNLPDAMVDALMPTMSTFASPQLLYGATAGDKDIAPCGQLARLRRRGIKGSDPSLAYLEWSIDPHTEFCTPDCDQHDEPSDPASWAKANPSLGIRISPEHVAKEHASMSEAGFLRERCGVGNYPSDGTGWEVISKEQWQPLHDPSSTLRDPVAFAADVSPGNVSGAIAAAGLRPDGLLHVEIIDHRAGSSWMVDRLKELRASWQPCANAVDPAGHAGSLIPDLEADGVDVVKPSTRDAAQAFGWFYNAVTDSRRLRHLNQPELEAALAGAQTRNLGEALAWDRKSPSVDIAPLVAATLALWAHATYAHVTDQIPLDGPLMA